MAQIGARGATEVARIHGRSEDGRYRATFVLTSDGRVLRKFDHERSFGVLDQIGIPGRRNRAGLAGVMEQFGYKPDQEQQ